MKTGPVKCPNCGALNSQTRFRYVLCHMCDHTIDLKAFAPKTRPRPSRTSVFLAAMGERIRILTVSVSVMGTLTALVMIGLFFTVEEATVDANAPATAATLVGLSSLLLVAVGRKTEAVLVAACCGGILMAKPLVFPMWAIQNGARYPVALTSPAHMSFLVPGGALIGSAFIFVVLVGTLKRRNAL